MKLSTSSSSAPATARSRRPTRRWVVAMLGARYAAESAMYGHQHHSIVAWFGEA